MTESSAETISVSVRAACTRTGNSVSSSPAATERKTLLRFYGRPFVSHSGPMEKNGAIPRYWSTLCDYALPRRQLRLPARCLSDNTHNTQTKGSYHGSHIPFGPSKFREHVLHGEILHPMFGIGMTHREWGQCGRHVKRTKALWCSGSGVEDTVDKAKDREESHLGTAADKLAEKGSRCRHGG